MNAEKNILIAFVLNLAFSVFEWFGGMFTGSIAIVSDAVHDLGDAAGIGLAWLLEKKSKQQPDDTYTYGYARYSVLGSVITSLILLFGSAAVVYNAIARILDPREIHYNGMIVFAVIGVCVNLCAAFFTREGGSLNQKAVNLHMMEDVLGWAVVLVGAIVMRFTEFVLIDPLLSVGVAGFIFIHAIGNLKTALNLFLEKIPRGMDVEEIRRHLAEIEGVLDVHHIHIRSMDGSSHYATMHIVTDSAPCEIKERVREELAEHGIGHVTLELETAGECCREAQCRVEVSPSAEHCHHHH